MDTYQTGREGSGASRPETLATDAQSTNQDRKLTEKTNAE